MTLNVYKVVLYVPDHDDIGAEEIRLVLEQTKYPNYCINPRVIGIEGQEIDWHDDHPLNNEETIEEEFNRIFETPEDEQS